MEYTLAEDGTLVDAQGKPMMVEGQPIKVAGAHTQKHLDKVVGERLAREEAKVTQRIADLEKQAGRTPELEKMLEEEKERQRSLRTELSKAKETASQEVSGQITSLKTQLDGLTSQLTQANRDRVTDQVSFAIIQKAGDRFVNVVGDVVPRLMGVHKREQVLGSDGKPSGEFLDTFRMKTVTEDGKGGTVEKTEFVPLERALELFAADPGNRHYVTGAKTGGSGGGGTFSEALMNTKRSTMSPEEQAEFIQRYGKDKYLKLPE